MQIVTQTNADIFILHIHYCEPLTNKGNKNNSSFTDTSFFLTSFQNGYSFFIENLKHEWDTLALLQL